MAALILSVLFVPVFSADAESTIRFTWAFVYQGSGQQARAIDYSEDIVRLQSGDKLKMYLRPLSTCYFYVYLHDAQKNLRILFMEAGHAGKSYTLPQEESWFYLDEHGGIELFYLIVSASRLRKLEAMSKRLLEQDVSSSDRYLIQKYRVLDEIKRIIEKSSKLADAGQRPIPVAGDIRGITGENEVLGMGVETKGIYVKTIRLAH
jgi:hypothetical protein